MIWFIFATALADDGFTYPSTAVLGPLDEADADAALMAAEPVCPPGEYVIKYWVKPDGVEINRDDSNGCLGDAVKRAKYDHRGGCSLVTQRVSFTEKK